MTHLSEEATSGIYHLIIRLEKKIVIQIGSLGSFLFPAGFYVYTGRARRGLGIRIRRHAGDRKKLWWHIDYLMEKADLVGVFLMLMEDFDDWQECLAHREIVSLPRATIVAKGFGSSDCQCTAHLHYLGGETPAAELISNGARQLKGLDHMIEDLEVIAVRR